MTICTFCSYFFNRNSLFYGSLRVYSTSSPRSKNLGNHGNSLRANINRNKTKPANEIINNDIRNDEKERKKFQNYDEMIRYYVMSARNSVLIRTHMMLNSTDLYSLISNSLGPSSPLTRTSLNIHCYSLGNGDHYYLCDIGRQNAERLIKSLPHYQSTGVPVRFRILSYLNKSMAKPRIVESNETINPRMVQEILRNSSSLEQQMSRLVNITEISPTGVAVRFFCASMIEDIFSGILPFSSCRPFGSTVNGFGQKGCDLDMSFEFEDKKVKSRMDEFKSNLNVNLRPYSEINDRALTQRVLDVYGEAIMKLMPFCQDVQPILRARVPIIKFNWKLGDFLCDLTTNNLTGQEMAKILWIYSQLDDRLRSLLFAVRYWAKQIGLTGDTSGPMKFDRITNFQLMCLVIFFMQIHARVQLPPINILRRNAVVSDDYGIVSQPSKIPYFCDSALTSAHLLKEFFYYYANFNFEQDGISLNNGEIVNNTDCCELYIKNPVELLLNVSKNVSKSVLNNFVNAVRQAVDIFNDSNNLNPNTKSSWGLLKLCEIKIEDGVSITSDVLASAQQLDELDPDKFLNQPKKLTINDLLSENFNETDTFR